MTPDDRATVIERWRQAGTDVAAHDEAQQARLREQIGSAEAAVLKVMTDTSESPSPTRVLELLARQRVGVTQSAGALAIQRLVASGRLRLTADAALELVQATS